MAEKLMCGEQFDTPGGIVWKFHGINGILVKDWNPREDMNQVMMCVEEISKKGWSISIGKDIDDKYWDCELNYETEKSVLGQDELMSLAILKAIYEATSGIEVLEEKNPTMTDNILVDSKWGKSNGIFYTYWTRNNCTGIVRLADYGNIGDEEKIINRLKNEIDDSTFDYTAPDLRYCPIPKDGEE